MPTSTFTKCRIHEILEELDSGAAVPTICTREGIDEATICTWRAAYGGKYIVYAASKDETGEGWIWFRSPKIATRALVTVENLDNGCRVCCEARIIDQNFVNEYNKNRNMDTANPRTVEVFNDAVFISEWYRNALGGFGTTSRTGDKAKLKITRARLPWLRDIRAACQHPSIVVKVGTRLGVLSLWLAIVALLPPAFDELGLKDNRITLRHELLIGIAFFAAILAIFACRGVRRLRI